MIQLAHVPRTLPPAPTVIAIALASLAACGKGDSGDSTGGGGKAAPPAKPPPAADAAPALREYVLAGRDEKRVRVRLLPPAGWEENRTDSAVYLQSPTTSMSRLSVSLTCHGSCGDAARMAGNIADHAGEEFEFTRSENHIPRLEPRWISEPREEAPGRWFYRFDADNPAEKQWEKHVEVDWVLPDPPWILSCAGEVDDGDDPAMIDGFEKLCRQLDFTVLPPVARGG